MFDYPYEQIAEIIGRGEATVRQLASRAKRHLEQQRPRFEVSREQRERLASRFFAAFEQGDLKGLESLLAADVVLRGDGGGRVPAIARPLHGRSRVARTMLAWARAARVAGVRLRRAEVNGQPGAITLDPDGRLISVIALDVVGAQIQAVNSLVNPDKLDHLGLPVVEPSTGAVGIGREGSEA